MPSQFDAVAGVRNMNCNADLEVYLLFGARSTSLSVSSSTLHVHLQSVLLETSYATPTCLLLHWGPILPFFSSLMSLNWCETDFTGLLDLLAYPLI